MRNNRDMDARAVVAVHLPANKPVASESCFTSETAMSISNRLTLSARTTRSSRWCAILVSLAGACASPTGSEPPPPTDSVTIDVAKATLTPVAQESYVRTDLSTSGEKPFNG
jgi:hypothetical protein